MKIDFTDCKEIAQELKKELGVETHETVKLEKNSKGFNYEIKIFMDKSEGDKEALDRLEKINAVLESRYTGIGFKNEQ